MKVEELASVTGQAILDNLLDRRGIKQALYEIDADVMDELRQTIGEIALAAVIPEIQAEALERAAVVAEGTVYHELYRTWPWWTNPDGSQGNRGEESDVVRHADEIAAAIRAMKEPDHG
jgi:hypothetical protein